MLYSLLPEMRLNSIQQQQPSNYLHLPFTSCPTHPMESYPTNAKTSYSLFPSHSASLSPHLVLSCIFMGSTQSFLWCLFPPAPPLALSLILYFSELHSFLFPFTFFSLKSSRFQAPWGISEIFVVPK